MRNFVLGFILGLILASCVALYASDMSMEYIFNRVWDGGTTLRIVGV